MANSIIPPVGSPGIAPNVQSTIVVPNVLSLTADATLYTDTVETLVTESGVDEATIVNAGAMWNRTGLPNSVAMVVGSSNFGAIVNSGLMVAESAQGSAQVINIQSSWALGGLHNTGEIVALAPTGTAAAIVDVTSFAEIVNSGVIAAQGLVQATALYRGNGGHVLNDTGGRVLAEGAQAVAIYLGRGDFDTLNGPTITNAGEVIANRTTETGPPSVGVLVASETGFPIEISNSGLISGDFAIFADEFQLSPQQHANERIVNEATGILRGVVYLAGGDNAVINRGMIEGSIFVEYGADFIDNSQGRILGVVQLGLGHDIFLGGSATDIVVGDRGDDLLSGGAGGDLLLGGRGNDEIDGGAGSDRIFGEFGDDTLIAEGGDIIAGGTGDDTLVLRDYTFADIDGGDGFDKLVLAESARTLSLSAVVASGRLRGVEVLELPGAQRLVIAALDITAISGGQQLVVGTQAVGALALVGAWTDEGQVVVNGQTYRGYHLGAEHVLVAGSGVVSVVAAPTVGATGLDAVGAGILAPLPSSTVGAELTQGVTLGHDFDPQSSLVIDADEQWISDSGLAPINTGLSLPAVDLTNNGSILSSGGMNGAIAVVGEGVSQFINNGTIAATGAGNPGTLPVDPVAYLQTLNLSNAVDSTPWGSYGLFSSFGYPLVNRGSISGASVNSFGVGVDVWFMDIENSGTIAGTSTNLIGVGVYTHNGGTLTNSGLIRAEGELGAFAIGATTQALNLTNTGDIVAISHAAISTSVGVDLYFQGFWSTINNSGLIHADVAIQTRMTFNPSGLVLYNSGQIVGRIELDKNPTIAPDRADRIVNTGVIIGDVFMGGERDLFAGRGGIQNGVVRGEEGNDALLGGSAVDELIGGDGDDFIAGGAGGDILTGGAGRDQFVYISVGDSTAAETDLITDFQSGLDTIDLRFLAASSVAVSIAGEVTTITAQTPSGVFTLKVNGTVLLPDILRDPISLNAGTTESDILMALAGGSALAGLAGDDMLIGLEGDDVLGGGEGLNYLIGGAGNDTYFVSNADDYVGEAPNNGHDTVVYQVGIAADLPHNVEDMVILAGQYGFGNDLDNVITGNAGDNILAGGAGADTLIGGLGLDIVDGGDGLDTASYATATAGVSVNLTLAGQQNTFGGGLDTLVSIENVTGSAFGDTLTGDTGNNVLSGGAGVDTLIGGLGDDVLIGGDNTDFIVDTSGVVSIDGGGGNEQITLGAAVISGVVDGGVGTDQLTKGGSIAGLTLIGIEILNTNGGTVTGTAAQFEGFDTIRFSAGQPFTAVSLALSGAGTVDLTDELLGRRALFAGTSGNDTITTSNGSDQIDGGAGDDVLTGNAGNDTLIGGLGDDVLSGGDGTDFLVELSGVVSVDGGAGDDVITLGAALNVGTVAGGLGTDQLNKGGTIAGLTISGIEIVNTNGGTLTATAAQLEGFDTIRFSAAQATTAVSLALSEAGTVDLTDELLGRRALFAGSSGNDVITTSNGSDQIDGGAGDDVLTGNAGVDTLIGGLGDDQLNGGEGGDFLVDLAGIVAIDAGDGDDTLTVGALVTAGTIAGGLGTDQLNKSGNLSAITVSGVEIVNTNGGTLTATAAQLEGFDTIRFSAAQATAAISLAQSGAGTVDLTDEVLGRRVIYQGSSGNDVVTTSNGADRVDGGSGDDTLNGGLGNDTVLGGIGTDLIVQGAGDGRDIIDGGAGVDTYRLLGTAEAETFRIMTRAEAVLAGITGLAGATEIVITRNGTDTASVIAELDNIEEIEIDSLVTTANNGNGVVDGGPSGGDTIIVTGNFATTSLDYSTISINGSAGNDTIDITGLTSEHRVVFASNGGDDSVVGTPRPQDVFGISDGIDAMVGMRGDMREVTRPGPRDESIGRTMIETDDLFPLDLGDAEPVAAADIAMPIDTDTMLDHRSVLTDYPIA